MLSFIMLKFHISLIASQTCIGLYNDVHSARIHIEHNANNKKLFYKLAAL